MITKAPGEVSSNKHQANSALQTPRLKRRAEQVAADDQKPQVKGRFYRHLPLPMPDIASGSQHSCSTHLPMNPSSRQPLPVDQNWPLRKSCLLSEFMCSGFKLCRASMETSWYSRNLAAFGSQELYILRKSFKITEPRFPYLQKRARNTFLSGLF